LIFPGKVLSNHSLVLRIIEEEKRKTLISRFLPSKLVERLISNPKDPNSELPHEAFSVDANRSVEVPLASVLFADIRHFTDHTRDMSPQDLYNFLNEV
jgi:class 3 adenylate cyclase